MLGKLMVFCKGGFRHISCLLDGFRGGFFGGGHYNHPIHTWTVLSYCLINKPLIQFVLLKPFNYLVLVLGTHTSTLAPLVLATTTAATAEVPATSPSY